MKAYTMDKRRMCPNCRAFITTDDKVCPYCQFTVGPKAVDRRSPADALGGLIPQARFTTMLIMLINTGLYVAMVIHTQSGGAGDVVGFRRPDAGRISEPNTAPSWSSAANGGAW